MSAVFRFDELPESRAETYRPPTFNLIYRAVGEFRSDLVGAYALNATPITVLRQTGTLFRQDLQIEPDGWSNYIVTVPYAPRTKEVGAATFSFDTTGGTINLKCAKSHVATYESSGVVAGDHHKGSIGVKKDGEIEGVDIVSPVLKLNFSFKHPSGQVTITQARILAGLTGSVNGDVWKGFQPGELLYLGSTGSDGTDAEAEVTYQFAASQNRSNLSFGDINNIAKKGFEAYWVEFKSAVAGGAAARQPWRVHIEQVYDPVAFQTVFPW